MIFEPRNRLEVKTPKGDGIIWLVTEYGHETDTMYTVIIDATAEMWQFTHKDIKVKDNITFRRNVRSLD
jgi:poly(3-hydroxybutyrate) depolymerase